VDLKAIELDADGEIGRYGERLHPTKVQNHRFARCLAIVEFPRLDHEADIVPGHDQKRGLSACAT
jgi:hypothetical protein